MELTEIVQMYTVTNSYQGQHGYVFGHKLHFSKLRQVHEFNTNIKLNIIYLLRTNIFIEEHYSMYLYDIEKMYLYKILDMLNDYVINSEIKYITCRYLLVLLQILFEVYCESIQCQFVEQNSYNISVFITTYFSFYKL